MPLSSDEEVTMMSGHTPVGLTVAQPARSSKRVAAFAVAGVLVLAAAAVLLAVGSREQAPARREQRKAAAQRDADVTPTPAPSAVAADEPTEEPSNAAVEADADAAIAPAADAGPPGRAPARKGSGAKSKGGVFRPRGI